MQLKVTLSELHQYVHVLEVSSKSAVNAYHVIPTVLHASTLPISTALFVIRKLICSVAAFVSVLAPMVIKKIWSITCAISIPIS